MASKTVTQVEWDRAKRSGYAETKYGVTCMLYLDEKNGGTVWGPVTVLDERDASILAERTEALTSIVTPKVGDFVGFVDGVERRVSHVWDFTDEEWSVQTSDVGSFYLGNGYASFSGGLHPGVPASTLTDTGETRLGGCWFFHHDHHRASNGVDVAVPFRVWACSVEATR